MDEPASSVQCHSLPSSKGVTLFRDNSDGVVCSNVTVNKNGSEQPTSLPTPKQLHQIRPTKLALPKENGSHSSEKEAPDLKQTPLSDPKESPPTPKPRSLISSAVLENARYELGQPSRSDHNVEDRIFTSTQGAVKVFALFDGHDGSNAVNYAVNYMEQFNENLMKNLGSLEVDEILKKEFTKMDDAFFESIKYYTNELKSLKFILPKDLNSYQAYMQYPTVVQDLQEIEPLVAGGSTAVIAVVRDNKLYVGNVGDSRALIIKSHPPNDLIMNQLTVDHVVEDELELERLTRIGLDRNKLIKTGRLGSQENTRSIGDYCLKEGYQDVDDLVSAKEAPGTSEPSIRSVDIDSSYKYLVLMSDGVYKSIEGLPTVSSWQEEFVSLLKGLLKNSQNFTNLAQHILMNISTRHERAYQKCASEDPRSPRAVQCRKRDDMSLIIHQFGALLT